MTAAGAGSTGITDVAVVGGGLAGLATAIHLARDHRSVVCVDHRPWPRSAVGESLEFSAPQLLEDLGVDIDEVTEPRHVFPKTSVRVTGGGDVFTIWPPRWFARPPIWCSRRALHADRAELDRRLMLVAIAAGVEMLPERVTGVGHVRDKITALTTNAGSRLEARWFVELSGWRCVSSARARPVLRRGILGGWTSPSSTTTCRARRSPRSRSPGETRPASSSTAGRPRPHGTAT